jgi:hypothetical protein
MSYSLPAFPTKCIVLVLLPFVFHVLRHRILYFWSLRQVSHITCSFVGNIHYQYLYYKASKGRIIDEMERFRQEAIVTSSTYYIHIRSERLRKTTKDLRQNSQCAVFEAFCLQPLKPSG